MVALEGHCEQRTLTVVTLVHHSTIFVMSESVAAGTHGRKLQIVGGSGARLRVDYTITPVVR